MTITATYHHWNPNVAVQKEPKLYARNGQRVRVLCTLTPIGIPAVGIVKTGMYRIEFSDGTRDVAFGGELENWQE